MLVSLVSGVFYDKKLKYLGDHETRTLNFNSLGVSMVSGGCWQLIEIKIAFAGIFTFVCSNRSRGAARTACSEETALSVRFFFARVLRSIIRSATYLLASQLLLLSPLSLQRALFCSAPAAITPLARAPRRHPPNSASQIFMNS